MQVPNEPTAAIPPARRRSPWRWVGRALLVGTLVFGALWLFAIFWSLVGIYWSLEYELGKTPVIESFEEVDENWEGFGAPFWGERSTVLRTYEAGSDAAQVCERMSETFAAWADGDLEPLGRAELLGDECGFRGESYNDKIRFLRGESDYLVIDVKAGRPARIEVSISD